MVDHSYELFRIADEYQFKCAMTTSNLVVWRECLGNDDDTASCTEHTYHNPTPGKRHFQTESVVRVNATMEPRRIMCKACQDIDGSTNCSNSNEVTITPVGES